MGMYVLTALIFLFLMSSVGFLTFCNCLIFRGVISVFALYYQFVHTIPDSSFSLLQLGENKYLIFLLLYDC